MSSFLVWIVIALFLLAIVGTPIVYFSQIIGALLKYFFGDWWNRNLPFTAVDPLIEKFLRENFIYYQKLSEKNKVTFVKRTQKFISLKSIEPREDLYITVEMEALVAAAAIQLTFGHPSVYFKHFDRIILYPDRYYSNYTDTYHYGEVNTKGVIVLSYKNLHEGFLSQGDGRNLGLHEMAHALRITDHMPGQEYDFLDRKVFLRFTMQAREIMIAIGNGEENFLRAYAATNDHEFFAVAVENFFERPVELKKHHPELYRSIVELLQQDPIELFK
jgi:MtfA peptidase